MPTWILIVILIVFVLSPLANGIAKAIETRSANRRLEGDEDGALRIGTLEEHVQLLSDQMHELAEKQDFLTRLLEASPSTPITAEPEDRIG